MVDHSLKSDKLTKLRAAHRRTRDRHQSNRIKAVILLASGWRDEDIDEVL
jgi:hypothetical protein